VQIQSGVGISGVRERFQVRLIEARSGGEFVTRSVLTIEGYNAALIAAEREQDRADRECLPVRCYVFGLDGVPCYAARMSQAGVEQARETKQRIAAAQRYQHAKE